MSGMKLKELLRGVAGKQPAHETYVDSASVPAAPEGPYRARMEHAAHHSAAPSGIDVGEREVVTGALQVLYRVSCPCGHQWDSEQFQRIGICAKCGRAVLVEKPTLP
jgi:hypothetical protein